MAEYEVTFCKTIEINIPFFKKKFKSQKVVLRKVTDGNHRK